MLEMNRALKKKQHAHGGGSKGHVNAASTIAPSSAAPLPSPIVTSVSTGTTSVKIVNNNRSTLIAWLGSDIESHILRFLTLSELVTSLGGINRTNHSGIRLVSTLFHVHLSSFTCVGTK
jgi:hypothetical protein